MGKVRLNEDQAIVAKVKEGLKRTGGYCPCRLERKPEYKCVCEEFKAQIQDPEDLQFDKKVVMTGSGEQAVQEGYEKDVTSITDYIYGYEGNFRSVSGTGHAV